MKIAVSACLLGTCCKYNGKHNLDERVAALAKDHEILPICPEMLGGLPCPRIPCEISGDKVINKNGEDKTKEFQDGARKAADQAESFHADCAILMDRSPSCSPHGIYDGSFTGTIKEGKGLAARALECKGIPIYSPDTFFELYSIST